MRVIDAAAACPKCNSGLVGGAVQFVSERQGRASLRRWCSSCDHEWTEWARIELPPKQPAQSRRSTTKTS